MKDGSAVCSVCGTKNPLGNLQKMSIQEVTESEIIVCFTRGDEVAHALHIDCKPIVGPWITFSSAEMLDKALVYLGATEAQMAAHRAQIRRCGHGSSDLWLLPNRKNLLRIDWSKL
jgi:hypothetical protein